jgi:hypothetical protein
LFSFGKKCPVAAESATVPHLDREGMAIQRHVRFYIHKIIPVYIEEKLSYALRDGPVLNWDDAI